ncbi:MAG: protein DA1 [Kouleothrix sp.]
MTSYLTRTQKPSSDHCAACGVHLAHGYYFLRDRADRYCPDCIASRPRCDACSAPVGDQHWMLHDGRMLCSNCHATAIVDPALARQLYDETVAAVGMQLGLRLRVGVEFRLVDAPTMAAVRAGADDGHPPDERTLGLYQRQGRLRAIYMLYGLPKLLFRTVVAHEYAHAWQGETCPLLEDNALREGFAEWVAYRHLLYLGCTRAAQRMLTSSHPYRRLREQVLAIEAQAGPTGVLKHIVEVGRGLAEPLQH